MRPCGAARMRAANICYNGLPMNKELIYPAECYAIRGAIYEVHNEMGSGFREEVYQQCLEREFASRSIPFDAKKELRIFYKGKPILVTGELHIDDFTTQSGEKKTRVDVTVDQVSFVPTEKTENQPVAKDTAIDDDDLPF